MAYVNVTLKKTVNGIVRELYPKSSTSAIMDISTGEKLSDILSTIIDSIGEKVSEEDFTKLQESFDTLVNEAPEEYDTLAKIAIALTNHLTEYENLVELVGKKVDSEENKSLIETDLIEKVKALYTKSELDKKFEDLKKSVDDLIKIEYNEIDDENAVITIV